jgi:hypothetical protein
MNHSDRYRRNRRASLQRGAEQIRAEGGGVYRVDIIPFATALFHPQACQGIPKLVNGVIRGKPPLCLLCDTEFALDAAPAAIVTLTAYCNAPTRGLVSGVCYACAESWETLQQRIVEAYRTGLISDLRVLPPEHLSAEEGRA